MQISEIFYSIQGEGIKMGLPTTFIRTSGCDLRCEWCDTKYAWDGGEELSVGEIMDKVTDHPVKRACVTGGEPLLQEGTIELIDRLLDEGYEVNVETNGSLDISELIERDITTSMDYKLPSSGMEDEMREQNLALLRSGDQLKFVIGNESDFDRAVEVLDKIDPIGPEIIFQPVGGKGLKKIAERVVKEGLDVRVLPQLHKIIWEDERRV